MTEKTEAFGRTIQLFLVDGVAGGLTIATFHGWTGNVIVASQATFGKLLARPEVDRTGVYILFGPDPQAPGKMRAYIGEADSVKERIDQSAKDREFWEVAAVITTSDETLNKGHVRYLEARLIDLTLKADRVSLDNGNKPAADRRNLSEADRASMEAFLANLKVILPVVGLDLLKPRPQLSEMDSSTNVTKLPSKDVMFQIRHKSNISAYAIEISGEFIVLKGAEALKDAGYATNSYAHIKEDLIKRKILVPSTDGTKFEFSESYAFSSPSAAGSVILDRNANGRTRWHVVDSDLNYHEWQEQKARKEEAA